MDLSHLKFDIATARAHPTPPEFKILLAGLSARQATTPTVRLQTLSDAARTLHTASAPLVELFAEGLKPDTASTDGRFSTSPLPAADNASTSRLPR